MFFRKALLLICVYLISSDAQMYNLTVTAGPGGTTIPSGTLRLVHGNHRMLAIPDSSYIFHRWTVLSGNNGFGNRDYWISWYNLASDATIQANFLTGGTVYDIDSIAKQYTYATHWYGGNPHIDSTPGVVFRFIPPEPGVYAIVVEDVKDTTRKSLNYFGHDSRLLGYRNEYDTGKVAIEVTALIANQAHYLSVVPWRLRDTLNTEINHDFTIRYEPAVFLTVEHSGQGSTFPIGNVPGPVPAGTPTRISAHTMGPLIGLEMPVSYFDHWEVVSGNVTIESPTLSSTYATVKSGNGVIRAVFLMNSADTLIIHSGNGGVQPSDTVYIRAGGDTVITAFHDPGFSFTSWSAVEGEVTFGSPSSAETRVNISGGKAVIRANYTTDTDFTPTVTITDFDISGYPDMCVTASVTDSIGKSVTRLDSIFFTLHEDGVSLPFHLGTENTAEGTSTCLVIEKGQSTAVLEELRAAAKKFIAKMGPNDRCAVVAYNYLPELMQEMTTDTAALNRAVDNIVSTGWGHNLLEGVHLGISRLLHEVSTRNIILLAQYVSDDFSRISIDSVASYANHNNVTIYGLFLVEFFTRNTTIDSSHSSTLHGEVCFPWTVIDSTGGYITAATDPSKMTDFFNRIRNVTESTYTLCYETPDRVFDGDTHSVVVSVNLNDHTGSDTTWWDESNLPPVITLTPATWTLINNGRRENNPLTVTAEVTDDGGVENVRLFYRTTGSSQAFTESEMTLQSGKTYGATVPADAVLAPGVDFHILAVDNQNFTVRSPNIPQSGQWTIPVTTGPITVLPPVIEHASCFADNGIGSVNRLEMYYQKELDTTGIPDSMRLCWPDGSQCRMARKDNVTLDSTDFTHLTVLLPDPFPEGITRYTEWSDNLGVAYGGAPVSSGAPTVTSPFAIADRVGPLIMSAELVERLVAGNDTLIISFTEWIDFGMIRDQCLTLMKTSAQGGVAEIPLTVVSAHPDTNGHSIVAVIPFSTETSAPKVGDSLRITAAGPIADEFGNRAHVLNRPAVITARKNIPDIISAVYEDRNADGMVDTVRMLFNKTVNLNAMEIGIEWNGSTGKATPVQFRRVGTGAGGDTVDVCVSAPVFPADATSGPMHVTVTFNNYGSDNVRNTMAQDGAAPVLVALRYHFGECMNENESLPDTVYAKFSEPPAGMPSGGQPFLFADAAGQLYSVSVDNPTLLSLDTTGGSGEREIYYRFIVTDQSIDPAPVIGDLSWINTEVGNGIIDAAGNIQNNGNNKRVTIYIRRPLPHLSIRVGPNPFTPVSDQINICITAQSNIPVPTEYRVSAGFYDKVGNLVKRFPEDVMNTGTFQTYVSQMRGKVIRDGSTWYLVTSDSSKIWWDGTNSNGRTVADGTYLAIPVIFFTTEGRQQVEYSRENILIGVKSGIKQM